MMLPNLYQNPGHHASCTLTKEQLQDHFDQFYEDMFIELAKFGEIEDLNICDNVGEHLAGSKWVFFVFTWSSPVWWNVLKYERTT